VLEGQVAGQVVINIASEAHRLETIERADPSAR